MTNQEAAFARLIDEGFNKGNFDAWDDILPPEYAEHQFGMPTTREGFKKAITGLRGAFPDLHLTIDEMVTSGDKVWARMTGRGTHKGTPFMGLAPSGKTFTITVLDVCRFENGKMVEHWGVPDQLALFRQIGGALGSPPASR
ncbi:MAG TPA: ester cyclase [Kofleriaceae bacterium]|nr:ester cyclase [Kofleriaceae bacterium]